MSEKDKKSINKSGFKTSLKLNKYLTHIYWRLNDRYQKWNTFTWTHIYKKCILNRSKFYFKNDDHILKHDIVFEVVRNIKHVTVSVLHKYLKILITGLDSSFYISKILMQNDIQKCAIKLMTPLQSFVSIIIMKIQVIFSLIASLPFCANLLLPFAISFNPNDIKFYLVKSTR